MKRIVDHSWFFLAEFACVTLAVILWITLPGLSWQPLLIAIAPFLLRIYSGRPALGRTPFDIPIAIFMLTAAVGLWAAYQPAGAWNNFWLLLSAVLFYYLIAHLPIRNLWVVAGILSLLGFGIGIFFILSNNWEVHPAEFKIFSQIGMAWMHIRPNLNLEATYPSDMAGIPALALPFSVALTFESWRKKSTLGSLLFGLMACLILATILLSASRSAWWAVGATFGLWILWEITGRLAQRSAITHNLLFIISLGYWLA